MNQQKHNPKIIVIPHGMKREIARTLNVNERTVCRALRGETDGRKSAAVRRVALEKLGALYGQSLVDGVAKPLVPSYLLEPIEYRVLSL